MKTIKSLLIFSVIAVSFYAFIPKDNNFTVNNSIVVQQIALEQNNIRCWIWNTGVIDQDLRTNNTPGFEWPIGSGKDAIFSAGLTLGGYVNNQLRLACASYTGEYVPGHCVNGTLQTNSSFKLYRVTRGDNQNSNPDWANWGLMVPYGAPYIDANHNGTYEPAIDTPGVRFAAQTVFLCMTDADPSAHTASEGFSGGTIPLGAEVHLTAWCYTNPGLQDMQFLKWVVINKNTSAWDSTRISLVCDPDLGDGTDDYIGCDTIRKIGYCYNADDQDGDGTGFTYGLHPPAAGMVFLDCGSPNLNFKSFGHFNGASGPICEVDPANPNHAYNYMKGFKRDGSPWIYPFTLAQTFFCYPGDPETVPSTTNWTEFNGNVANCGGPNGTVTTSPNPPGDRRFIMNFSRTNSRMNPGDSQVVQISQLIARGNNNKNSVTLLKSLSDTARAFCTNGFVIGINPISTEIPKQFSLSQNYPNPFNPSTIVKFDIPPFTKGGQGGFVQLIIYNALGQEITTLVNEQLRPGVYEVEWNAANYPSGVYFYKLVVGDNTNNGGGDFFATRKMVLLK